MRGAGGELRVVETARAVHDEGGTQASSGGQRVRSDTYYYFNIRNRLLFAGGTSIPPPAALGPARLPEAYEILQRGGRRQLLTSAGPWRAAVRGTIDGLRALRRHSGSRRTTPAPLRVLQSFPAPRPTTNPYIVMFDECLDANPRCRAAHVHLAAGADAALRRVSTPTGRRSWSAGVQPAQDALLRQALYRPFLARLRLQRTAIVRHACTTSSCRRTSAGARSRCCG